MDHNPGWHWLLQQVNRRTGLGPDALVTVSVLGLFVVALVLPGFGLRRPEAWAGALLICQMVFPTLIARVMLGRPFALTIGIVLALLLLWRRPDEEKPSWALLAGTTCLLAISAWMHGAWYLFGLVICAFVLAGQCRSAAWLAGCWVSGTLLGALATGHPFAFLWNALRIVFNAFSGDVLQRMLVTEFWPSDGNVIALLAIVVLLFWRSSSGRWTWACVNNPIFILVVLGWILGLRVARFYADWAAPALLLWMALELAEHLGRLIREDAPQRLAVAVALSLSLVFATTADAGGRWTNSLSIEFLSAEDPEMAPWLPEADGVMYAADMTVFYQTFFKNPHAPWRYILGFEPTFMPPEDLKIYRNIQRNFGAYKAYGPWVNKMRPEDRLVIRAGASAAPTVPGLEWHYTARDLWLGRKPRPEPVAASAPEPVAGSAPEPL
jgi:hypothetical protein